MHAIRLIFGDTSRPLLSLLASFFSGFRDDLLFTLARLALLVFSTKTRNFSLLGIMLFTLGDGRADRLGRRFYGELGPRRELLPIEFRFFLNFCEAVAHHFDTETLPVLQGEGAGIGNFG